MKIVIVRQKYTPFGGRPRAAEGAPPQAGAKGPRAGCRRRAGRMPEST